MRRNYNMTRAAMAYNAVLAFGLVLLVAGLVGGVYSLWVARSIWR
jgi:hypothetical protein